MPVIRINKKQLTEMVHKMLKEESTDVLSRLKAMLPNCTVTKERVGSTTQYVITCTGKFTQNAQVTEFAAMNNMQQLTSSSGTIILRQNKNELDSPTRLFDDGEDLGYGGRTPNANDARFLSRR